MTNFIIVAKKKPGQDPVFLDVFFLLTLRYRLFQRGDAFIQGRVGHKQALDARSQTTVNTKSR